MDSSSTGEGAFRVRPMPIDLGRLRVDGAATRIWVDGVETLIPAMEFLLLRYLAERHGEIVTREELVSAGWGEGAQVPSNSLNVHLARIRRRFPAGPGEDWLRPVRGIGYQLIVPPRLVFAEHRRRDGLVMARSPASSRGSGSPAVHPAGACCPSDPPTVQRCRPPVARPFPERGLYSSSSRDSRWRKA